MNKKISLGAAIALMAITAAVTLTITMVVAMQILNISIFDLQQRQSMFAKITEIDNKVRQNYNGEIDQEALNDSLAMAYVKGIGDKHSDYFTAEEYQKASESMDGKSVGMGVEITPSEDKKGIYIFHVMQGSPAETAGMKEGDVIVKVGDQTVESLGYNEAVNALYGKAGDKISFVYTRDGKESNMEITLNKYEDVSVYGRVIQDTVGYITIREFNDNTDEQFEKMVNTLLSQGATSLLFDVRNNGGGTLDSAANMIDLLCPAGNIVSRENKDGTTKILYTSDAKGIDVPMAVLTNEHTASAAELFSCALRDYKKAKLVGVTTYGKGTMQTYFPLDDGSAIKFTVAKFLPPKSENFEGVGLTPDMEVALSEEQQARFYFLSDDEDPQLQKAVEYLTTTQNMAS